METGRIQLKQEAHGWMFSLEWGGIVTAGGPYPERLAAALGLLYQLMRTLIE